MFQTSAPQIESAPTVYVEADVPDIRETRYRVLYFCSLGSIQVGVCGRATRYVGAFINVGMAVGMLPGSTDSDRVPTVVVGAVAITGAR